MPRCRHLVLSGITAAILLAAPARAQVSGSATWLSDDRYRGGSLSGEAPTASVAWAWDGADGWYAGTQFTRVRFARGTGWEWQAAPYLGVVVRTLHDGATIDAGVQYTGYSRSTRYATTELYVGWNAEHRRARLSWTPDYFGTGASAWYIEGDGDRPLRGRLRLVAHLGVQQTVGGSEYARRGRRRWQTDLAAGLGYARDGFDLQARWTTASDRGRDPDGSGDACVPWRCGARSRWVVWLTRTW